MFFFAAASSYGQVDSCIVIWPGTTVDKTDTSTLIWNPDSTYVDTCGTQPPYRSKYCRRAYQITFDWYVIHSPVFANDTVLVYEWTAIDTAFSDIRNGFQTLESAVGHFTLTKLAAYIADTSSEFNKIFILRFDSLLNVDTVLSLLSTIPNLKAGWSGMPRYQTGSIKQSPRQTKISIWPQPSSKGIYVQGEEALCNIVAYNSLGKRMPLPIRYVSENLIEVDVSKVPEGILYFYISGQVFKILIQQ